jgi:hypothetical protein
VDRKSISNAVYSVEHRLLSARSTILEHDKSADVDAVDMSQITLLAAHLYLHLAVRELPGHAKMHLKMLYSLQSCLLSTIMSFLPQASDATLALLLWVLFIGAAASSDQVTRLFFVQNLQHVSAILGLQTRREFEEMLKEVLWLDGFCAEHCAKVWEEMNGMDAFIIEVTGAAAEHEE